MNLFRYPIVVALGLWIVFAPAKAYAQERVGGVDDSSAPPRVFRISLPQAPHLSQQRTAWMMSARFTADGELAGLAQLPGGAEHS